MTEVPSGTVTAAPSMVSVTCFADCGRGRAVVDFVDERHGASSIPPRCEARRGTKSSGKCLSALITG